MDLTDLQFLARFQPLVFFIRSINVNKWIQALVTPTFIDLAQIGSLRSRLMCAAISVTYQFVSKRTENPRTLDPSTRM